MKDVMMIATGTSEYDGFVIQRGQQYYIKIVDVDTEQDIFTSEPIYQNEDEALEDLENKIDEMYI